MNDWGAVQARKHYIRQMRWERFRDLMAYSFWPMLILVAVGTYLFCVRFV